MPSLVFLPFSVLPPYLVCSSVGASLFCYALFSMPFCSRLSFLCLNFNRCYIYRLSVCCAVFVCAVNIQYCIALLLWYYRSYPINKYKYKNFPFLLHHRHRHQQQREEKLSLLLYSHFYAHKMNGFVKRKNFRSFRYFMREKEKYAQILIQTKLHAHSVFIYGNCYLLNGESGWILNSMCVSIQVHTSKYIYIYIYIAQQPIFLHGARQTKKTFRKECKQADI